MNRPRGRPEPSLECNRFLKAVVVNSLRVTPKSAAFFFAFRKTGSSSTSVVLIQSYIHMQTSNVNRYRVVHPFAFDATCHPASRGAPLGLRLRRSLLSAGLPRPVIQAFTKARTSWPSPRMIKPPSQAPFAAVPSALVAFRFQVSAFKFQLFSSSSSSNSAGAIRRRRVRSPEG